ncbi:GAP family protein [Microbacterium sp. NPDC057944]|uniref:GAP family protein n=1 Tax=Microbacterium sp. NPDC057944 TaxID=3346286 RepID=UPI0036DA1ED7
MNEIAELIPLAVGIVISPLPIVATVAILLSARGRVNGAAFAGAVVTTAFAITLVGAFTAAGAGGGHSDGDDVVVFIITAALAVGFAVLAVASWLTRPRRGQEPKMPSWLAAVDTLTPLKAAGLGALMGVTNAKNLPLEVKAGALIGAHDLPLLSVIGLSAVFAVGASLGILLLALLAAVGSAGVQAALQRLKSEMVAHNAAIMTVLFAVLAATEVAHLLRMHG